MEDAIDYSPYDREALVKLLWNRDRQAKISREFWVRAAKAALAGDTRELRNRIDLAESGPLTLTNGHQEWHVPGGDA
jgi:hypothetical protein